mmetsp:Transcript_16822/g.34597  ORF Transcript_16822/g.34597 Transcript_16822/m.34597 type:complete len:443 (-) Transcript_16822:2379-3707(-)
MGKSNELERQSSEYRARSEQISKFVGRFPLTEVSDPRRFQVTRMLEFNRHGADCILSPANNYKYDENKQEKFELMNVKIIIYGLNGLMCEHQPTKKPKFGKKETTSPTARGVIKGNRSRVSINSMEPTKVKEFDSTTAVVSCQRNGISNQIAFETSLPSLPLGHPIATSLNRVRYTASWPSEQLALHQEDEAKEQSTFEITRSMKQASFTPGIGAGSNYCHETLEVGINISRNTELIRLGTALIVIDGEEEGEVIMNIPATPLVLNSKKLKKRKNKYGYFSNDLSRRFFLEKTSVLRIGVQVIPQDAIRFAHEKEKKRIKKENELNELLEDNDFIVDLLQKMGDDNLEREGIQIKSLNPGTTTNGTVPGHNAKSNSFFPDLLCGSIPVAWVPNFLKRPDCEPDIPKEIITDNNLDQLAIRSSISSVSESTNDDIIEEVAGEF